MKELINNRYNYYYNLYESEGYYGATILEMITEEVRKNADELVEDYCVAFGNDDIKEYDVNCGEVVIANAVMYDYHSGFKTDIDKLCDWVARAVFM